MRGGQTYKPKPKDLKGEQAALFRALVFNAVDAEMIRREHDDAHAYGQVRGAVNAVCAVFDVPIQEVFWLVGDIAHVMDQRLGQTKE